MELIAQRQGDSPRTRCAKSDKTPNVRYKSQATNTDAPSTGK